jgi:hypothetical protein
MHYPDIRLEGLGKTTKTSGMIASVPAETQTKHLPTTSVESYRHNNLLDFRVYRVYHIYWDYFLNIIELLKNAV